jgi:hypothetical protein
MVPFMGSSCRLPAGPRRNAYRKSEKRARQGAGRRQGAAAGERRRHTAPGDGPLWKLQAASRALVTDAVAPATVSGQGSIKRASS